jgi:hypothetical protein
MPFAGSPTNPISDAAWTNAPMPSLSCTTSTWKRRG